MSTITTYSKSSKYCHFSAIKRCNSTSTDHKVDLSGAKCCRSKKIITKIAYVLRLSSVLTRSTWTLNTVQPFFSFVFLNKATVLQQGNINKWRVCNSEDTFSVFVNSRKTIPVIVEVVAHHICDSYIITISKDKNVHVIT